MRVALVASSFLPCPGGLERHVGKLATGLVRRGAMVEVLTQNAGRRLERVSELDGVIVRRFQLPMGSGRGAVAPGLWEHLRRNAGAYDLAHIHTPHPPFAAALSRIGPRRVVFTPHAPVQLLVRWPYVRVTRAVVDRAALTLCTARVESDLLSGRFVWAADRIRGLTSGVDAEAIASAEPFPAHEPVVLAVGRLERYKRVDRAIAAMASLGAPYRLVVVGGGPCARRLAAHAQDLRVHSRVEIAGPLPDAEYYRWLRTARVHVALAEHGASGIEVAEALIAGIPVVASDIPVHRETASSAGGTGVIFVSPEGSPLEVADAITEAARPRAVPAMPSSVATWDAVADATLALYEDSPGDHARSTRAAADLAHAVPLAASGAGPDGAAYP